MNKNKLFPNFPPVSDKEWENQIIADLKGADYEKKLIWETPEGLRVKPFYRASDLVGLALSGNIPGEFPYGRGVKAFANNWEIRENVNETDFHKANLKAVEALAAGADSVSFKTVFMSNDDELGALLKDIDIEKTPVCFHSSESYPLVASLLSRYIKFNNLDASKVSGAFNFDSFGYYLLNGEYYNSFDDNINELACLMNVSGQELPEFTFLNVNGCHFADAGASVLQELAFSLASAHEYLNLMVGKGIPAGEVVKRMSFTLSVGSSYFLEIAKYRAIRPLWAKIAEQYGVKNPKVKIHAVNSFWNKTIYDSYVNLLRTTTESMAAAVGGCDSISVMPFNITYGAANDFSARLARNQQIILKAEAHFDKIADPAGGSYYIENLTELLAEAAWQLFQLTEEKGGFVNAMESGFIREEINKTARKRDMGIALRKHSILGTNQYPDTQEKMPEGAELSDALSKGAYLKKYRGAMAFEKLRFVTENFARNNGTPSVFLLTIGNPVMMKARAAFAANFFGCAGFNIIDNVGFKSIEDGAFEAVKSKADIVVVCSSDEEYAAFAPTAVKIIKENNKNTLIIVAGNPIEIIEELKSAGVDDFIHVRTNVIEFLTQCQHKIGMSEVYER